MSERPPVGTFIVFTLLFIALLTTLTVPTPLHKYVAAAQECHNGPK